MIMSLKDLKDNLEDSGYTITTQSLPNIINSLWFHIELRKMALRNSASPSMTYFWYYLTRPYRPIVPLNYWEYYKSFTGWNPGTSILSPHAHPSNPNPTSASEFYNPDYYNAWIDVEKHYMPDPLDQDLNYARLNMYDDESLFPPATCSTPMASGLTPCNNTGYTSWPYSSKPGSEDYYLYEYQHQNFDVLRMYANKGVANGTSIGGSLYQIYCHLIMEIRECLYLPYGLRATYFSYYLPEWRSHKIGLYGPLRTYNPYTDWYCYPGTIEPFLSLYDLLDYAGVIRNTHEREYTFFEPEPWLDIIKILNSLTHIHKNVRTPVIDIGGNDFKYFMKNVAVDSGRANVGQYTDENRDSVSEYFVSELVNYCRVEKELDNEYKRWRKTWGHEWGYIEGNWYKYLNFNGPCALFQECYEDPCERLYKVFMGYFCTEYHKKMYIVERMLNDVTHYYSRCAVNMGVAGRVGGTYSPITKSIGYSNSLGANVVFPAGYNYAEDGSIIWLEALSVGSSIAEDGDIMYLDWTETFTPSAPEFIAYRAKGEVKYHNTETWIDARGFFDKWLGEDGCPGDYDWAVIDHIPRNEYIWDYFKDDYQAYQG